MLNWKKYLEMERLKKNGRALQQGARIEAVLEDFPPLKVYPDQVHRVGNPPNAATSQPNGPPSSEMMLLCR